MIKCIYNGLKVGHNPVKKKEKIASLKMELT